MANHYSMYIEERNAELLAKRARADLVICARPHAHTSGVRQFARPHEFLSFRTRARADVRKSCARCTPLNMNNWNHIGLHEIMYI